MNTCIYWQLVDSHSTGESVLGSDIDTLVDISSFQTVGALRALGAGAISDIDMLCTKVGNLAKVAVGAAIIEDSTMGWVFALNGGVATVSGLTSNTDQNFLFAQVVAAANLATDPDTRKTGTVNFNVLGSSSNQPGLLLAQITTDSSGNVTNVVDRRPLSGIAQNAAAIAALQTAVTALQTDVGSYNEEANGTIAARLTALESGGGGGGGGGGTGTVYWGGLAQSAASNTTIAQAIAAAISAFQATLPTGSVGSIPVAPRDEIAVTALLNRLAMTLLMGNIDDIIPMDRGFVFVPGVGHNKVGDALSIIDYGLTTVNLDESSNLIG